MFREAGVEPYTPGTVEFKRFADRLNSPEPIATFALTNSLAAFLAPWLAISAGIGLFGATAGVLRLANLARLRRGFHSHCRGAGFDSQSQCVDRRDRRPRVLAMAAVRQP